MKWSSVKNLILGLLIVMNLFMLTVTIIKQLNSEKIPTLARAGAIEAMKNSGISCPDDLMPDKYMSIRGLKAQWFTASELSPMFFGEQLAFQTQERSLIASRGGAVLRVEDNGFSYDSGREGIKADEKQLRRMLKGLGFDMSLAQYEGNGRFGCVYGGRQVFGMYITAELSEDASAARIEARWPKVFSFGRRESGISIIECIPSIIAAFPQGGRVKSVELGYELVGGDAEPSFCPAWKVAMENGEEKIFPN